MSYERLNKSGDTIYNPIEKEVLIMENAFIHNYWNVTPVINKRNRIIRSDTFSIENRSVFLNIRGEKFKFFNQKSFLNDETIVFPELRNGGGNIYDWYFFYLKPDSVLENNGTKLYQYKVSFKSVVGLNSSKVLTPPSIEGALEYSVVKLSLIHISEPTRPY